MGNRVYAQLRLAPWDEGTLGEADAGRALLDAIDDYGFFEKNVEEDCGVPVGVFTDPEASWGTAAFVNGNGADEPSLVDLAIGAGLWAMAIDEGDGVEFDPSAEVFAPDGRKWLFSLNVTGRVVMDAESILEMLDSDPSGGVLREHLAIGRRTLGEWYLAEGSGRRGSPESSR